MSIKLQNDYKMPPLVLGTYCYRPDEPWVEMVKYGISIGYRHIDSSPVHQNEKMIGEAISDLIFQGEIDREEIFVTSKLWNNKHEKDAVVPALKRTLANLNLQYVDLYLIHWPFGVPDVAGEFFPRDKNNKVTTTETDFKSTWKGMEDCVEKGLAKSIGVSNFNIRQVKDLCRNAKVKPAVLQIECHPYLSQVELVNYCRSIDVAITATMPQGKKLPAMKGRTLLNDPVVNTLAGKYKKTPAQICVRYQVDRGLAVIPKCSNKRRLEENINVFDFSISEKDVLVLDCLNKDERYLDLKEYSQHKYYPFRPVVKEADGGNPLEITQ